MSEKLTEDMVNYFKHNTYEVNVKCTNCHNDYDLRIAKGKPLSEEMCRVCGCVSLRVLSEIL